MSQKVFPIQIERLNPPPGRGGRAIDINFPRHIPWFDAERAYQEYSRRYGTRQSLERLAERGGFGPSEFVMFYYKQPDDKPTWDFIEYWRARYITELKERGATS